MIVTLTLNPSLDIKMVVERPRLGVLNRARRVFVEPSGKGINVSRALAALGRTSLAVAPLGGPFGDALRDGLVDARFELAAVPIAGATRANTKILDADSGELTEFNAPGAGLTATEWRTLHRTLLERTAAGDVLVLSGSLPPSAPDSLYAELIEQLRQRGVSTVLDTAGRALAEALPSRPDLVKPNRREAADLVGHELVTLADAVAAAASLRGRGAATVALTLGAAGAVLASAETTVVAVPPRLPVRNLNGAGDALIAGLLRARLDGADAEAQVRYAVATGSARAREGSGAFGTDADVREIEAGVASAALPDAAADAGRDLPLDTLTADTVRAHLQGPA